MKAVTRHSPRSPVAARLFEAFEPRVLLSATPVTDFHHTRVHNAAPALQAAAPFDAGVPALALTLGSSKLPFAVQAGSPKNYAVQFVMANSGTGASAKGTAILAIVLHSGTGDDIPLLTRTIKFPAVKANRSAKLPAIPIQVTSAIPPGSYAVAAVVTPAAATALPAMAATGPSVVVTTNNAPGIKALLQSKSITFSATGTLGLDGSETGAFVTGDNLTGSYAYAPDTLVLEYANGAQQSLTIHPAKRVANFDAAGDATGTTYTLDTKAAKASFGATIEGDKGKVELHRVA